MATPLWANEKSAFPDSKELWRDPIQPAWESLEEDEGGTEESSLWSFWLLYETSTLPLFFLPEVAVGSSGMSSLDTG